MRIEIYRRNRDSADELLGEFLQFDDCINFILDGKILGVAPEFLDFEQATELATEFLEGVSNVRSGIWFSAETRRCARTASSILKEVSKMATSSDLIAYGPLDGDGFPVFPPQNYVVSEQLIKAMILRLPLDKVERQDILVEFIY